MRVLINVIGILFLAAAAFAQFARDPDYRLGTGDLIEVSVIGIPEYQHSVRIGRDGKIVLPYVGEVEASGKTSGQLAAELKESMDGRIFQNPQVLISVKEFRSNPIILMGAVGKPGRYEMVTQMRLIDLLVEAGGVQDKASDTVTIQRSGQGSGPEQTIKVNVNELFERGTESPLNIPLKWGDLVTVVPKKSGDIVYIIGDVGKPGIFDLPSDRKVRLTQAMAAAGGTLKTAKANKSMIVRYDDAGNRKEIAFDFKKVLAGKQPDPFIEPKDVIFVPGSTMKTLGFGILNLGPTAAVGMATRGVIY